VRRSRGEEKGAGVEREEEVEGRKEQESQECWQVVLGRWGWRGGDRRRREDGIEDSRGGAATRLVLARLSKARLPLVVLQAADDFGASVRHVPAEELDLRLAGHLHGDLEVNAVTEADLRGGRLGREGESGWERVCVLCFNKQLSIPCLPPSPSSHLLVKQGGPAHHWQLAALVGQAADHAGRPGRDLGAELEPWRAGRGRERKEREGQGEGGRLREEREAELRELQSRSLAFTALKALLPPAHLEKPFPPPRQTPKHPTKTPTKPPPVVVAGLGQRDVEPDVLGGELFVLEHSVPAGGAVDLLAVVLQGRRGREGGGGAGMRNQGGE
jgi:hypothetical protein